VAALHFGLPLLLRADVAEQIGLTALRRERPTIVGTGIPVAQPEGEAAPGAWEVNPAYNPAAFFAWTSSQGTATNFPNAVGVESSHADNVAAALYGIGAGVAPGVPRVDNYDASYFIDPIIKFQLPIQGRVINNSWFSDDVSDDKYDTYVAVHDVVLVSGMNNAPDTPHPPGSCLNGMGVGLYSTSAMSSVGPTTDGRAKPDLVAPDPCCSSFATPLVAGAAALLLQAGAQNDGGKNTEAFATNSITVKALLINGAVKMTNWTNSATRPLDARYGAGILNIYNSDLQLRGQRRAAIATNSVSAGSAHPPTSDTNNVGSLRGWDYSTIQNAPLNNRVAHYFFQLPSAASGYSVTATLVWKKGFGALNNLDLFLYDARSNLLVTSSTSTVDNVEHIFIPRLPAGRYDLQVLLRDAGGETYALAFDFSPATLVITRAGTNRIVSWPASPAGYVLQSANSLTAATSWQNYFAGSVLSNEMNTVTVPAASGARFFRLIRP
jgi:hypothetical protein